MIRISRFGWCGVALVLLAPWAVLLWILNSQKPATDQSKPIQAPILGTKPVTKTDSVAGEVRSGPWGRLSYRRIAIEPPEEFIPANYVAVAPRWTFKSKTAADLATLWTRAQLTPEQRAQLDDPARQNVSGDGIVIEPSHELILGLSSEARTTIYTALAEFQENAAQREPFRFRSETIDEWFEGSGLSEDIIALTKRLIYHRNGTAFFSDYDLVLPRIAPPERTLYLKALSRKSALLVTLHVDRDSDTDALARYWGRGRRAKDVKPLLQSLGRQSQSSAIDIVHLVPRFARSLLYTFPLPSDDADAANRDCHWTSFNFNKEQPDERFTDIEFVKQTLLSDYYPVGGEPQLGDIIMFVQPGGVVVHSCVYIADDIVFTKNGPSFAVPWQFSRLESVLSFYTVGDKPIETRRYRSRSS